MEGTFVHGFVAEEEGELLVVDDVGQLRVEAKLL